MTAMSPPSLFLAPHIVEPGPSAILAGIPLWVVPGVTCPVGILRARRRARRPIWLTAQCEVDRDQQISSCAIFWDDGKSIEKSSGIAAYVAPYDKILIAIEIGRAEIRAFEDCASKSLPERPPQCPTRGFHAAVS